jgi:hypothetical protein
MSKPYDIFCNEEVREKLLADLGFRNYYALYAKINVVEIPGPYYYFNSKPYFVGYYEPIKKEIRTMEALLKLNSGRF